MHHIDSLYLLTNDQWGGFWDISLSGITQRFRYIDAGKFLMGSKKEEQGRSDNEDVHDVTLTDGFWLADTPVTQLFWEAVMRTNPSRFKGNQLPVEQVSWYDIQDFLGVFNQYNTHVRFYLPTEAQWEYACRAGSNSAFYFGDIGDVTLDDLNYSGKDKAPNFLPQALQQTSRVKQYVPNAWGLYGMHGNVWEWCQDVWQEHLGNHHQVNPLQQATYAKSRHHVVRGGSWLYDISYSRSASRYHFEKDCRNSRLGFRLCLDILEDEEAMSR